MPEYEDERNAPERSAERERTQDMGTGLAIIAGTLGACAFGAIIATLHQAFGRIPR